LRAKLIFFVIGLVCGLVCGALVVLLFINSTSEKGLLSSAEGRALSLRIESIPMERICESISSGKQILGDDHVTVWSDQKRYVVEGWRVGKVGVPIVFWIGADLPADVPSCKK
jgi:hypothetical protein